MQHGGVYPSERETASGQHVQLMHLLPAVIVHVVVLALVHAVCVFPFIFTSLEGKGGRGVGGGGGGGGGFRALRLFPP